MIDKGATLRDWTHEYFLAPLGQLTFHVSRKIYFSVPEPSDYSLDIPVTTAVARRRFYFLSTRAFMTFINFDFDERLIACVKECGYVSPTPIQQKSIPLILKGHDLMGLAQTGTGKTAAFALPILQRLLSRKSRHNSPRVLVLAPTRELATQISDNFTALSRKTGVRNSIVIGGVGMGPQIRNSKSSQVIVACPGRLVALLAKKAVDLRAVDTLVLDEADRMLDMGFMPDIRRILSQLPTKRQNLLFSATMPESISALARKILVNPKTVEIKVTSPVSSVDHKFYRTENSRKISLLQEIISRAEHQSMLVFTKTKHKAKKLARKLSNDGYNTTFLQGNMSQNQREKALNGFRDGSFDIMVATDIAARGIDCDRITHVINYDMPDTVETYTHRIGRTGRAGRSGNAITLATEDDASQLRAIQRVMGLRLDPQGKSDNERSDDRNFKKAEHRPVRRSSRNQRRSGKRRQSTAA